MNDRIDRADSERRSRRHRRRSQGEAAEPTAPEPQTADEAPCRRRGLWLWLLLCLVGSGAVSYVVFKYIIVPSVPLDLVGTWQVTEGPLQGATLEFRQDGTATATRHERGKTVTTHSSVEVRGKRIFLTTRDAGTEEMVIQRILKLTADELVIRDEDKLTYPMKRIRN
jgi:uncharacterized protein (TIGR03066 family)